MRTHPELGLFCKTDRSCQVWPHFPYMKMQTHFTLIRRTRLLVDSFSFPCKQRDTTRLRQFRPELKVSRCIHEEFVL